VEKFFLFTVEEEGFEGALSVASQEIILRLKVVFNFIFYNEIEDLF
jgi:hypothetical protein